MKWIKLYGNSLALAVIFCLVIFLSMYRLTESPPTWLDEGMIVQTSKNLVEEGRYMVKMTPDIYSSPSFISTSYPVTYPVALSFKLFGISLLSARIVMVAYLILFVISAFYLIRRFVSNRWLVMAGLLLLATFPPLYGNGKNVLGEVPGLLFLNLFLIFVDRIDKGDRRLAQYVLAGLALGLCVSTKPIFILLLIAAGLTALWILFKKRDFLGEDRFLNGSAFAFFTAVPICVWLYVQFKADSVTSILSYYANPHGLDVAGSLAKNIQGFFSAPQSLYFFIILVLWMTSISIRYWSKKTIGLAEHTVALFSILVFLAYFRNPAYYRYFFLAEVYSLILLPQSLNVIFEKIVPARFFVQIKLGSLAILTGLVVLQTYQLFFTSWVATHYQSTKTAVCSKAIGMIPDDKTIFFYQVPELVIFRPGGNYYQYLDSIETNATRVVKTNIIERGVTDYVIVSKDLGERLGSTLDQYVSTSACERYDILSKRAIK